MNGYEQFQQIMAEIERKKRLFESKNKDDFSFEDFFKQIIK